MPAGPQTITLADVPSATSPSVVPCSAGPGRVDGDEIDVVVEFKAKLENAIAGFRKGTKTTNDIDLLVCWDVEEEKLEPWAYALRL